MLDRMPKQCMRISWLKLLHAGFHNLAFTLFYNICNFIIALGSLVPLFTCNNDIFLT